MIVIIGAGAFGQTIASLLGKHEHALIDVEPDGTYSPESIDRIKNAERAIICVPSHALPDCLNMIQRILPESAPILSCTKGLYDGLKTPTELISEHITNPTAALTGPNLSNEIKQGKPTMTVIAGDDAPTWARLLHSDTFIPLIEQDKTGAEFAGAVKNIIALGVGLIHGYYGEHSYNTMGSLLAFATRDIKHLYDHKNHQDIPHLSFIGDLFATCLSENSRNHKHGHATGQALANNQNKPEPEGTVEGLHTLTIIYEYAQANKVSIPTISALFLIFFQDGTVDHLPQTWR